MRDQSHGPIHLGERWSAASSTDFRDPSRRRPCPRPAVWIAPLPTTPRRARAEIFFGLAALRVSRAWSPSWPRGTATPYFFRISFALVLVNFHNGFSESARSYVGRPSSWPHGRSAGSGVRDSRLRLRTPCSKLTILIEVVRIVATANLR